MRGVGVKCARLAPTVLAQGEEPVDGEREREAKSVKMLDKAPK